MKISIDFNLHKEDNLYPKYNQECIIIKDKFWSKHVASKILTLKYVQLNLSYMPNFLETHEQINKIVLLYKMPVYDTKWFW